MAVIEISDYFPHQSYGIVRHKGRFLSEPAKRFIDISQECYGKGEVEEGDS